MHEIIRITADRKTLYMRIPPRFKKANHLKKGDYLVCDYDENGEMTVRTWEAEKHGKT